MKGGKRKHFAFLILLCFGLTVLLYSNSKQSSQMTVHLTGVHQAVSYPRDVNSIETVHITSNSPVNTTNLIVPSTSLLTGAPGACYVNKMQIFLNKRNIIHETWNDICAPGFTINVTIFQECLDLCNKQCWNDLADEGLNISSKVRLLCWILCDVPDLEKRVRHVRDTWAKRCDITLYMASEENKTFPTIGLNVTPGRNHIAFKSKAAWKYIYANHFHDADFFMKADPDTYAVVENIKVFLSTKNTSNPEFYGHRFLVESFKNPYMSGGPGLIITKESLKRLVTKALTKNSGCIPDGQGEDYKTANCLYSVGAKAVDCRDQQGRDRFVVFHPALSMFPGGEYPDWFYERDMEKTEKGPGCCSDYPLSFHYLKPPDMYILDYFLYHARPHGKEIVHQN